MNDFPSECFGCPFQSGTFEFSKEFLDNFSCQCGCLENCSFYDDAKIYVDEVANDIN